MKLIRRLHLRWSNLAETVNRDERGLTTAELLGNAALGVVALVAIWQAMRLLGLDIVSWIQDQTIG
jgi:hypothetical protein